MIIGIYLKVWNNKIIIKWYLSMHPLWILGCAYLKWKPQLKFEFEISNLKWEQEIEIKKRKENSPELTWAESPPFSAHLLLLTRAQPTPSRMQGTDDRAPLAGTPPRALVTARGRWLAGPMCQPHPPLGMRLLLADGWVPMASFIPTNWA
jgi:hypothetical protein